MFWIGEDLTPWMEDAVETLATDATVTTLLEADGVKLLDFREGALFEAHDHDDHDDEEHAAHDDHDDHDDHTHDAYDPEECVDGAPQMGRAHV